MSYRKAKGLHPRREPSGRLSRSTEHAVDAISPAAVRRLRDAALQKHADPLWGSEIGRLFLCHNKLTSVQFEAAKRWQRLAGEYYKAIGSPLPWEKPGTLGGIGVINGVGLGDDPPVDSAEGRRLREKRWRYISEMEGALAALGAAGALLQALRHTVEQDKAPVGVAGLEALRAGLDRLGSGAWRRESH